VSPASTPPIADRLVTATSPVSTRIARLPRHRYSTCRHENRVVIWLLPRASDPAREREEARLRESGFDAILDDPRTFNALLADRHLFPATGDRIDRLLRQVADSVRQQTS
jgi:hypothetical protein